MEEKRQRTGALQDAARRRMSLGFCAKQVFQEVDMDFSAEAIPRKAAPGFGNDVDVAVGVHVAGL